MLVTGYDEKVLKKARNKAIDLFDKNIVTEIVTNDIKKYKNFMICLHGINNDFEEELICKQHIDEFISFLNNITYSSLNKNNSSVKYVVVSYGDCVSKIERRSQPNKFV